MPRQVIISFLAVLVTLVAGCGGAHHYDGRLVQADSLMPHDPDSALALVQGISPDSLPTPGDRAYRDLLLTQGRYKCYITATSDSDINRALAYYSHHSDEREKLTRAYIYKGAVMEELGYPDSAMTYYKNAETTADPSDYANLGYAKLRMGEIYGDLFIMDGQDIIKYEEALNCFSLVKDSVYLLISMNNLGCLYRETQPDRAESLLMESYSLARKIGKISYIAHNDIALIELYEHQGKLAKARRIIWEVLDIANNKLNYDAYFTISKVYAKLGITDSAELFFNYAKNNHFSDDPKFRMHLLNSLSVLSLSRNDSIEYLKYKTESDRIEDSLIFNGKKLQVLLTEVGQDKKFIKRNQHSHDKTVASYRWIILLVILALLLLSVMYYLTRHRFDRIVIDLKREHDDQSLNMKKLQYNLEMLKINDSALQRSIECHMTLMGKVIEACYHSPRNYLANKIKALIKFQDSNKDIWSKLYTNLDNENNYIITHTKSHYPQLNERELLMIALTCMGYSCAQIAIILDYSTATSISTIRTRIAQKMGLNCSLADYIKSFKLPKKL